MDGLSSRLFISAMEAIGKLPVWQLTDDAAELSRWQRTAVVERGEVAQEVVTQSVRDDV